MVILPSETGPYTTDRRRDKTAPCCDAREQYRNRGLGTTCRWRYRERARCRDKGKAHKKVVKGLKQQTRQDSDMRGREKRENRGNRDAEMPTRGEGRGRPSLMRPDARDTRPELAPPGGGRRVPFTSTSRPAETLRLTTHQSCQLDRLGGRP